MKAGDIVTITDGSYTQSVVNGKLVEESLNCDVVKGRHYTVIETGCSFPLNDYWQPEGYRNDTVIQDESGKVVFIHNRFLRVVEPAHVWEHGDVFKNNAGLWVYLVDIVDGPYVVNIDNQGGGTLEIQLGKQANMKFLFNIKDRL